MTIYFIRHAIAQDHDKALKKNIIDSKRQLTQKGILKFCKSIKKYDSKFKKIDLFISSPYLRAIETLDLVLELKSIKKPKVKIYKLLRPNDNPTYFLKWIKKTKFEKVVVVSHEPFMSSFLKLISKNQWEEIEIKKGQVIELEI